MCPPKSATHPSLASPFTVPRSSTTVIGKLCLYVKCFLVSATAFFCFNYPPLKKLRIRQSSPHFQFLIVQALAVHPSSALIFLPFSQFLTSPETSTYNSQSPLMPDRMIASPLVTMICRRPNSMIDTTLTEPDNPTLYPQKSTKNPAEGGTFRLSLVARSKRSPHDVCYGGRSPLLHTPAPAAPSTTRQFGSRRDNACWSYRRRPCASHQRLGYG